MNLHSVFSWLASAKSRNWRRGGIGLYLLVHLATLPYFPLPWQDETYNVSITLSFMEEGSFVPKVARIATDLPHDIRYGPVFFALTSLVTYLFGLGIFQFRLVTFVSGLGVFWLTAQLLRQAGYTRGLTYAAVGLLALDPFFGRCLHEGRMDLTALFFMLFAFLLGEKLRHTKNVSHALGAGTCVALALLTTPRIGFLLIAFAPLLWAVRTWPAKQVAKLLGAALAPPLVFYSAWVYYAFGSYPAFFAFFASLTGHYTQLSGFYNYIQKNQYILLPAALLCALWTFTRRTRYPPAPLLLFALLSLPAFYVFVKDPGPYSVFITPSFYILIFSVLFENKKQQTPAPATR